MNYVTQAFSDPTKWSFNVIIVATQPIMFVLDIYYQETNPHIQL